MTRSRFVLTTGVLAAAVAGPVSAAPLATFNFTGTDPAAAIAGGTAFGASSTDPDVSVTAGLTGIVSNPAAPSNPSSPAGALIAASSVTTGGSPPAAASNPALRDNLLAFGPINQDAVDGINGGPAATLADVLAANTSFLTFKIAPDAGQQLDLDTISFDFWAGQGNQSADMVSVFTSVDGFSSVANVVGTFDQGPVGNTSDGTIAGSGASATYAGIDNVTLNFTGTQFDSIAGEVEVRLYFYSGEDGLDGNANRRYSVIDNLVLSGTVIPEPGTLVLAALGSVMVLARRRREQA